MYIANPTTEVNNFVFIHRYLLYFFLFFPPHFAVFFNTLEKKRDTIENPYKKTLKCVTNDRIYFQRHMTDTKTQIVIVEDDVNTRFRLERILEAQPNMHVVGAASTKREAEMLIAQTAFDVLLVDLLLPDGSGIDIIRRASQNNPQSEIIVVTAVSDDLNVVSAIEAGATGYILKESSPTDIVDCIHLLLAGGSPVSPTVARSVLRAIHKHSVGTTPAPKVTPEINPLSQRETEILQLLAKGMSFNEIGEILAISPHTVTAHIKKIYRKLQVHSRGEAVYEASQMGLL